MTVDLNTAIARLKDFRASWDDGDEIDEASGLTAADIDAVLAKLDPAAATQPNPVMRELRDD